MSDNLFSYHIFSFPFKWKERLVGGKTSSHATDFNKISPDSGSLWKNLPQPISDVYRRELYNEKNFFYQFIHPSLYDSGKLEDAIRHYERDEPYKQNVFYNIKILNGPTYKLNVKSISLDLYFTGVGILSFYLENHAYRSLNDVLHINQFGRRIYPPYFDVNKGLIGTKENELANELYIEGLLGRQSDYYENFESYTDEQSWKPAKFISQLLDDLKHGIAANIEPVIDDRMFVSCWMGDNEFSKKIAHTSDAYKTDIDWYKLLFVDVKETTCQNDAMLTSLLEKQTLLRWQKYGTLYGISRYSMVCVTNEDDFAKSVLLNYFRTMYYRMAQLCLVQRASVLKFSDKITEVSSLNRSKTGVIADEVSDLYREYIRFINKVYFREVTAQEQGIEIYQKLQEATALEEHVKALDGEIEELHNYASLLEEKDRNRSLAILTLVGAMFVAPSFIIGYLGMNIFPQVAADAFTYRPVVIVNLSIGIVAFLVFLLIKVRQKIFRSIIFIALIALLFFLIFIFIPSVFSAH